MGMVIVNPGTGPVVDANEEDALVNVKRLLSDTGHSDAKIKRKPQLDYGEGRFAFVVKKNGRKREIQMPGLPLDLVRYTGENGQNIWNFPRLYLDDSSWVWKFAANILANEGFAAEKEEQ